ncbi:hypothetical protein GT348_07945 [Aristophania vespae]|uniref:Porin n=1 Tax=Aristophania vespae TaxID=2697033 RepID=A0A6P1NFE5_9PROT|nr:hypothetical protein [Aristophania vespae]QHI96168.1 hypothetical protein GT348_07945 [Aristophania vespae]
MMTPSPRLRPKTILLSCLSIGTANISLFTTVQAATNTADAITVMEKQIHALQNQLNQLKTKQEAENKRVRAQLAQQRELIEANPYASRDALLHRSSESAFLSPVRNGPYQSNFALGGSFFLSPSQTAHTPNGIVTATPPAHPDLYGPLRRGQIQIGGVRVTLGGFLEAATIWRSRQTGADIASGFNAIPWKNQPAHHMSEFRQSERQSRLAVLVEGMITKKLEADAYVETDFQGAGSASNSRQSNSYVPRARVVYGELKDHDDGLYFLGGKTGLLLPYLIRECLHEMSRCLWSLRLNMCQALTGHVTPNYVL